VGTPPSLTRAKSPATEAIEASPPHAPPPTPRRPPPCSPRSLAHRSAPSRRRCSPPSRASAPRSLPRATSRSRSRPPAPPPPPPPRRRRPPPPRSARGPASPPRARAGPPRAALRIEPGSAPSSLADADDGGRDRVELERDRVPIRDRGRERARPGRPYGLTALR